MPERKPTTIFSHLNKQNIFNLPIAALALPA